MRLLPAVDIRGARCVNLVQGDYDRETVFSCDPVAQAVRWREEGAALVHVVDLDGAKAGRLCVVPQLLAIGAAHVPFEIGGGIRDLAAIQEAFEAGAARVILGTAAYHLPQLVEAAAKQFPGKIAVAIDARAGKVALQGWQEITSMEAVEFARVSERAGASRIIYTDILSDGMMEGPNLEATEAVARAVNIPVTASGGISSLDDVRALRSLEEYGVDEAIIGRALYLGRFTLAEAMAAAQEAP